VSGGTNTLIQLREGESLLNKLGIAVFDSRIFSAKHPRFLESCEGFLDALQTFREMHDDQDHVLFLCREGRLYFRKVPMTLLTPPSIKLARLLDERDVQGVRFSLDCNLTALSVAIKSLAIRGEGGAAPDWNAINRRLEADGLKRMVSFFTDREVCDWEGVSEVQTEVPTGGGVARSLLTLPQLSLPLEVYQSTLAALHDLMSLLGSGGNPDFDKLLDISTHITEGVIDTEEAFLQIANVKYEDPFTFNHSVNVCLLVISALKPIVTDRRQLVRIGQAALLHDLGKSLVSDKLFYGDAEPHADELHEIERHSLLGAEVLQDTSRVDPLSVVVAFEHHRRPNGEGYPTRRQQSDLDPVTSVVAVADIFEALTAERPYKKSLTAAEAFALLPRLPEARGLGRAMRLLFDALGPFPPGTIVELDTGERAVVTQVRRGMPDRPCVRRIDGTDDNVTFDDVETDLAAGGIADEHSPRVRRALESDGEWDAPAEEPIDPDTIAQRQEVFRRAEEGTLLATEG
jgi:HD-GYP domain-containing protein (c-di-GMP phosphodiesterase class II)